MIARYKTKGYDASPYCQPKIINKISMFNDKSLDLSHPRLSKDKAHAHYHLKPWREVQELCGPRQNSCANAIINAHVL